jgi:hypothetical protein
MPYREPWVQAAMGSRSVLQVCLDVHMDARGSYQRGTGCQELDIRVLRHVVETWKNHGICEFDDAVLHLVRTTVAEYGAPKRVIATPPCSLCGDRSFPASMGAVPVHVVCDKCGRYLGGGQLDDTRNPADTQG